MSESAGQFLVPANVDQNCHSERPPTVISCYCYAINTKLASSVARGMPQGVGNIPGDPGYNTDISFIIILQKNLFSFLIRFFFSLPESE